MSGTEITIRPATEADVPAVHDLILQLADYEKLRDTVQAEETNVRAALFGERPCAEALIAEAAESTTPVGFALYFINYSTFVGRPGLYLEDLFVVPEFRGRGIGKQLLRELASIAAERNCGRMEWVVLDWNESAIGFYEKLGARVLADWRIVRLDQAGFSALATTARVGLG